MNNQEPTRECCDYCKYADHCKNCPCHSIKPPVEKPLSYEEMDDMLFERAKGWLSPELSWDIKSSFEANFLDGDKINDCGGSTFTAIGALDVAEFFYEQGKEQAFNSGRASMVEIIEKICERHINWKATEGYGSEEELGFQKGLVAEAKLLSSDILQALKNKETKE